jgi:hypothetical protein
MINKETRGGFRQGAGRKTIAEQEQRNNLMIGALHRIFGGDEDEDTKVNFLVELLQSPRGQMFVAEHLFGKPKELNETILSVNDFNIKDVFKIGNND